MRSKEDIAFDFAMFLKIQNKPEIKRKTQIQQNRCYVMPLIHSFESSKYPQNNMNCQRKEYKKESKI
jgi:hypothetical protein